MTAPVGVAGVPDGTSNTIMIGETLPEQDSNSEIWGATGTSAGTTIPINFFTGGAFCGFGCADKGFGTPGVLRPQGLQEQTPRRGQLPLRRRLREVPQGHDQLGNLLRPRKP